MSRMKSMARLLVWLLVMIIVEFGWLLVGVEMRDPAVDDPQVPHEWCDSWSSQAEHFDCRHLNKYIASILKPKDLVHFQLSN